MKISIFFMSVIVFSLAGCSTMDSPSSRKLASVSDVSNEPDLNGVYELTEKECFHYPQVIAISTKTYPNNEIKEFVFYHRQEDGTFAYSYIESLSNERTKYSARGNKAELVNISENYSDSYRERNGKMNPGTLREVNTARYMLEGNDLEVSYKIEPKTIVDHSHYFFAQLWGTKFRNRVCHYKKVASQLDTASIDLKSDRTPNH